MLRWVSFWRPQEAPPRVPGVPGAGGDVAAAVATAEVKVVEARWSFQGGSWGKTHGEKPWENQHLMNDPWEKSWKTIWEIAWKDVGTYENIMEE